MRTCLGILLLCAVPIVGMAQPVAPLDVTGKLQFHASVAYSPWTMVENGAYAGFLQGTNSPKEWGQGASAYGERFASASAATGIHAVLGFGLDSALHQDPRYYRSLSSGFWRRAAHVIRGTVLTRTDRGGETLSTWRIGSAYGTAFLSNQWYPARVNTVRGSFSQGSLRFGVDFASNLGKEFGPDIKRMFVGRKP